MHEDRIERIADGGSPDLRVIDNPQRHLWIGPSIDVRVTDAGAGFDHRYRGVLDGRPFSDVSKKGFR